MPSAYWRDVKEAWLMAARQGFARIRYDNAVAAMSDQATARIPEQSDAFMDFLRREPRAKLKFCKDCKHMSKPLYTAPPWCMRLNPTGLNPVTGEPGEVIGMSCDFERSADEYVRDGRTLPLCGLHARYFEPKETLP